MQLTEHSNTGDSYSQSVSVFNPTKFFFISGQVPETDLNFIPTDFRSQCLLVWQKNLQQLSNAEMNYSSLVKVTIYLSDRRYTEENKAIRKQVLGKNAPALTIIIVGIYDERWLLEIDAIEIS